MTTPYEIPLSPQAQAFFISLVGVRYRLTVRYVAADVSPGWMLDIADSSGTPLVCGIPLVCGVDLLAQYAYLGIGVGLYVATDGNLDAPPTFANLGTESHLYFTVST